MIKEVIVLAAAYPLLRHVPGVTTGLMFGVGTSVATTAATWGLTSLAEYVVRESGLYLANSYFQHDKKYSSVDINEDSGWNYVMKDED